MFSPSKRDHAFSGEPYSFAACLVFASGVGASVQSMVNDADVVVADSWVRSMRFEAKVLGFLVEAESRSFQPLEASCLAEADLNAHQRVCKAPSSESF